NSLPSSPLVDIPLRTSPRIPSPTPTTASSPNPLTRFINYITSSRLNNPPPPHRTLFTNVPTRPYHPLPLIISPTIDPIHPPDIVNPIHPEETDPVHPVIVDINPPNKEPIRTPISEVPLVNLPDP
ncbi:18333_t:CDS:1, partial [Gigaspora margarita]